MELRGERVVLVHYEADGVRRGIHHTGPPDKFEVPRRRRGEVECRIRKIKPGGGSYTAAQRRIDVQTEIPFRGGENVLKPDTSKGAAITVHGDIIKLVGNG